MTLLDSSVMIDALRKRDPRLQQLFQTLQPAICGIVTAEVLYGAREAAAKAVRELRDYDFDAYKEQRESDRRESE